MRHLARVRDQPRCWVWLVLVAPDAQTRPPPLTSRKYNSLIQTQARELSHLRQRMREGQRVCHILTQNMGDTTKVEQTQAVGLAFTRFLV